MLNDDNTARIYLIRHATPDWTRTDIPYDIPPGPPLVAKGEMEAALLGSFIQKEGLKKLYHSPLERAKRTAQISSEIASIQIQEEHSIAEWRHGENEEQLQARLMPTWDRTVSESQRLGSIGWVTHGGPVRLMLEKLCLPSPILESYRSRFDAHNPMPPAGIWLAEKNAGADKWNLQLVFIPGETI